MKKQFTPHQKASVVLAALKGDKTVSQISSVYQIHPTQVRQWEKTAKEGLQSLFTDKRKKEDKEKDDLIEELYKIIGQRDTELAWLKKKLHLDS
jgi:transposase-like protein